MPHRAEWAFAFAALNGPMCVLSARRAFFALPQPKDAAAESVYGWRQAFSRFFQREAKRDVCAILNGFAAFIASRVLWYGIFIPNAVFCLL
jgi:hypothetical protein